MSYKPVAIDDGAWAYLYEKYNAHDPENEKHTMRREDQHLWTCMDDLKNHLIVACRYYEDDQSKAGLKGHLQLVREIACKLRIAREACDDVDATLEYMSKPPGDC